MGPHILLVNLNRNIRGTNTPGFVQYHYCCGRDEDQVVEDEGVTTQDSKWDEGTVAGLEDRRLVK